jgi:hypothetical protein
VNTRFESDGTYEDTPVVLLFNRSPKYVICNISIKLAGGPSDWFCALALHNGRWMIHGQRQQLDADTLIALTTETWNAYLASLIVT